VVYASICLITGSIWGAPLGVSVDWTRAHEHASALAALCCLSDYAAALGTGQTRRLQRSFPSCSSGCSYRLYVYPVVAHPAPCSGLGGDPGSGMDNPCFRLLLDIAAWAMWGIFIMFFRFVLERRRQIAEQDAALSVLEASLELTQ